MTRFYTADPHFGHKNIITHCDRPFSNVEEMNEALVDNWNSVVGPDDEVWLLGDVAMSTTALPIINRLHGIIYLVPGNHDRCHVMHCKTPDKWERACHAYEQVGITVMGSRRSRKTRIGDHLVLMNHFPYDFDPHTRPQYKPFYPKDEGAWLLHGHIHGKVAQRGRQIDVGVDAWDFTPVSEDQIAELIRAG